MSDIHEPRLKRVMAILPWPCALIVFVIPVLVLIGWATNDELLKSLMHPDRVAMNPLTAILLALSATALCAGMRNEGSPRSRAIMTVGGATLVIIACVRLITYIGWWKLRPDIVLFNDRLAGNVMAPNTAIAFLLVGVAFILLDRLNNQRRFHPSQGLALLTLAIAVLSLIGYLYDIASLYKVYNTIPMALNTAIAFLALSTGILCSRTDREPVATIISPTLAGLVARRLMPGAVLVPIAVGGALMIGLNRGLYSQGFGMAMFVLVTIAVFVLLIWLSAVVIASSEMKRQVVVNELTRSERRYHAIMRQAIEGIYLVDLETKRIIESNTAMTAMLGYSEGEIDGMPIVDLVADDPERINERLTQLLNAQPNTPLSGTGLRGERQYRRKDGAIIDVFASASTIAYGDRVVACTVVHDITLRKRNERLLLEKNVALERAVQAERDAFEKLRQAQSRLVQSEKLASLGQMVAGVAHEINNPLSFVSNNLAVLQRDVGALNELLTMYQRADDVIATTQKELIEDIRDLAERMDLSYTQTNLITLMARSREGLRRIQQIVKDLRDFARLDESELQEVDLNAGIESTINIVIGRAKKKRVTVKTELSHLPLVACYPAKINQVVMNLVANAIDACPEEGEVLVRTSADDAAVRIAVSDNGAGVPENIREKIFDPFFTTKPQGEGTGLGLSISYGIVQDHGGTIEVTNAPAGGAMFTVTLPVRKMQNAEA